MPPAFLQVAIPVLYVYDEGELPEAPPGFEMSLLPVISRALKEHANTPRVTVITGSPTSADDLPRAYTSLGLQYHTIKKATPEAGNLLVAEFIADHFDPESVLDHLKRIVLERQRELAEGIEAHTRRRASGEEGDEGDEGDEDEPLGEIGAAGADAAAGSAEDDEDDEDDDDDADEEVGGPADDDAADEDEEPEEPGSTRSG